MSGGMPAAHDLQLHGRPLVRCRQDGLDGAGRGTQQNTAYGVQQHNGRKRPSSAAQSGMEPAAAALTIAPASRMAVVAISLQSLCLMSSQFIPIPPDGAAPQRLPRRK